jgi:phytoene synthase
MSASQQLPLTPVTLQESYALCRKINRTYGQSYFAATYLLPRFKRHHVHALYAMARFADDIVDELGDVDTEVKAKTLRAYGDELLHALDAGESEHAVLKAVVHTARAFDIPDSYFVRFMRSMEMDLDTSTYETFDDLLIYMDGSAAVIGEMMLPILEPVVTRQTDEYATTYLSARALGNAFQLTNFLRDINEDLDRGRIYVPMADIKSFNAMDAFADRRVTGGFVELMQFEIGRCRELYRQSLAGVEYLQPASQRCVQGATELYSGILDMIEQAEHDVFSQRVRVPTSHKLLVAGRAADPTDAVTQFIRPIAGRIQRFRRSLSSQ